MSAEPEPGGGTGRVPSQNSRTEAAIDKATIFEMTRMDICQEACRAVIGQQCSSEVITALILGQRNENSDSDESDEESLNLTKLLLIKAVLDSRSEQQFLDSIEVNYENLLSLPLTILRPYQAHITTTSGCNRVTVSNLEDKFGGSNGAREVLRFTTPQLFELIRILKIAPILYFDGYKTTAVEALTLWLHRMSSHCRFVDLAPLYDLRPQFLSQIFNGMTVWLSRRFEQIVRTMDNPYRTRERLEVFSDKVSEAGCPLVDTVGFPDGTAIKICRPSVNQRLYYCGHHKAHCFKTMVIQWPDGIMNSFGPFKGNTHDSTAAEICQLERLISTHLGFEDRQFVLYADSGYGIREALITPFRRTARQPESGSQWNRQMSAFRISVEWGIGKIKNLFKLLTNKENLKMMLMPVSMFWFNGVQFTNLHTVLNGGNQISSYFDMEPPTIEEYLMEPSTSHDDYLPLVLNLVNRNQTCYAVSLLQVLHHLGIQDNGVEGDHHGVRQILDLLNTPAGGAPLAVDGCVEALNLLLHPSRQFQVGRQHCATEFAMALLDHLPIDPNFLTQFKQEGICPSCGLIVSCPGLEFSGCSNLLMVAAFNEEHYVDLAVQVTAAMEQPALPLCRNLYCPRNGQQVPGQNVVSRGLATIFSISRRIEGSSDKDMRPVRHPAQSQHWRDQQCSALLCHTGRDATSGHWLSFLCVEGVWWRSDSSQVGLFRQDPFAYQANANRPSEDEFTIDLLFFRT